MNLDWVDIAKDDCAIDLAINLMSSNKSSSAFFDEFIDKAVSFGFSKREAFKFVCLMISTIGGLQVYLPKEDNFKKLITYRLIYRDFKGSNTDELAMKYGLSVQTIGRIVSACRTADKEARKAIEGLN